MAEGTTIKVGGTYYTVAQVVEEPFVFWKPQFKRVQRFGAKRGTRTVGGETFAIPIYRESYAAVNDMGEQFLVQIYFEQDTEIVSMDTLREKIGKGVGDKIEPRGFDVYVLDVVDSIKNRKDNHLCYVWRIETALDYLGDWAQRENALAMYVREKLPKGTSIVLSGTRYTIDGFLSAFGAFSTVFQATRFLHGRNHVALKIQHSDTATYEANVLQVFNGHENIVSFMDLGEISRYHHPTDHTQANPFVGSISVESEGLSIETTLACLVVELVDGLTLEKFTRGRRVPSEQAVDIIQHLCDVIEHIHRTGYLHLDLKPQNVMIDNSGVIKIVDMGSVVAKGKSPIALGVGPHAAPEVKEYIYNQPMGRFLLARLFKPKQIEDMGELSTISQNAMERICEATDVFSVGALFSNLLVGHEPRHITKRGESAVKVEKVLISEDDFPSEARRFIPVIEAALDIEPQNRIQSCCELKQEILKVHRARH